MAEKKPAATRLGSLDALRGFVMFMLLGDGEIGHAGILSALFAAINQPWAQTICHQLRYSQWGDVVHVKDLVRPLFIFVVGVAMPYSFGNLTPYRLLMKWVCQPMARRFLKPSCV